MSFVPLFCPNPECAHHHRRTPLLPGEKSWFRIKGRFSTHRNGEVQRYQCKHCGHTFSQQTFSVDYRLRHPVKCSQVLASLFTGQGQRQLARVLGIGENAVACRLSRLGAQALAAHARFLEQLPQADTEIVFDGFETFVKSQYHPLNVNLMVGKRAEVVYGFNLVFLKRKGRMTPSQKAKREEIESRIVRQRGHGIDRSAELFVDYTDLAASKGLGELVLYTDKHRDYPAALKKAALTEVVHHESISLGEARTRTNPLFPVNYLDRQLRKDKAEYVRETTRWAQRPDRMMERLAVYLVWHNLQKPYRIKDRKSGKHGQQMGVSRQWCQNEWERLQTERAFPAREPLREFHRRVWNREDILWTVDGQDVFGPSVALGRLRA